jgi:hypothetical protein
MDNSLITRLGFLVQSMMHMSIAIPSFLLTKQIFFKVMILFWVIVHILSHPFALLLSGLPKGGSQRCSNRSQTDGMCDYFAQLSGDEGRKVGRM